MSSIPPIKLGYWDTTQAVFSDGDRLLAESVVMFMPCAWQYVCITCWYKGETLSSIITSSRFVTLQAMRTPSAKLVAPSYIPAFATSMS